MEKAEFRTVIHLQIGETHEYYGSPSSLYDKHTADELGIAQASLNNYFYKLLFIQIINVPSGKGFYM